MHPKEYTLRRIASYSFAETLNYLYSKKTAIKQQAAKQMIMALCKIAAVLQR